MNSIVRLILVLVGLLVVLYLVLTYLPMRPIVSAPPSASESIEMTTATIEESTTTYMVDARYPQFGIPAIDTQIMNAVRAGVDEFEALPPNPPDSATAQMTFSGTFDKVYVGPDIISLELVLSQYTGGAHSIALLSGMNFDRASGRLLMLDDALEMIGLTVHDVSAQASAYFTQKFGDSFFVDGVNTNPENFSSFTISKDKVTFIFQEYQVAAYAAGPQEFSFERVQ